eukprot:UN12242
MAENKFRQAREAYESLNDILNGNRPGRTREAHRSTQYNQEYKYQRYERPHPDAGAGQAYQSAMKFWTWTPRIIFLLAALWYWESKMGIQRVQAEKLKEAEMT